MEYDVFVLIDDEHPQHYEAYEDWFNYLKRFLKGLGVTTDYTKIEDAIQETYIKVYSKINTYDPNKSKEKDGGRAWVSQIAKNNLLSILKKSIEINSEDIEYIHDSNSISSNNNFVETSKLTDLVDFTKECIARLNSFQKKVFLLAFNGGLTNREITKYVESPNEDEIKELRTYSRKIVLDCIDRKSKIKWVDQNGEEDTFKMLIGECTRDNINLFLKYLTQTGKSTCLE